MVSRVKEEMGVEDEGKLGAPAAASGWKSGCCGIGIEHGGSCVCEREGEGESEGDQGDRAVLVYVRAWVAAISGGQEGAWGTG